MIYASIRRKLLGISYVMAALLWISVPTHAVAKASNDLPAPKGDVVLEVYGAISATNATNADNVARFDWAMLKALPPKQLQTHTSVTDGVHTFDGFLVRDLLEWLGATGSTVSVTALNYYTIDIPIEEFDEYDIIMAYAMDGKQLHARDKGPLWIVYPRDEHPELQDIRYDYRWVWQVIRLDIL